MFKKSFLVFICLFISNQVNLAKQIPVKIAPTQIITTKKDSTDVGDRIKFEVIKDVYDENGKLILKKGDELVGTVDFIHPNGWVGDSAEVKIKHFHHSGKDRKSDYEFPICIKGKPSETNKVKRLIESISTAIRGSEVFVEPDSEQFDIFIEH